MNIISERSQLEVLEGLFDNKIVNSKLETEIEQLRAENAALKEQYKLARSSHIANQNELESSVLAQQETITRQSLVIEQMREAIRIGLNLFPVLHQVEQRKLEEALALQPSPEIL